jgi:predicted dehydrogenase
LFGIAGLGGYAAYVCDRLLDESRHSQPQATLHVVADPELERFPRRVEELRAVGVTVVRDFSQLLAEPVNAVWLPLPIDLHLSYTEQALSAGKAVMCEKPAAGAVDDVDRMIAARDRSGLPVAVGFQDLYQPAVAELKQRLLNGEFGQPTGARVIGCWPRSERYFKRNDWAGRMKRDGRWIMDSPANNALAHFIHLTFFLLGDRFDVSAQASEVTAELYRANDIENYDTCCLRFIAADLPVLVVLTHAAATSLEPFILLETERARITYVPGRHILITGEMTEVLPLASNPHPYMINAFASWVRQGRSAGLGSTLEMARTHVAAVNVASEATPVANVPANRVRAMPAPDGSRLCAIEGILTMMKTCFSDNCLFHEAGLAPWTRAPRTLGINGYHHFVGPAAVDGAKIEVRTLGQMAATPPQSSTI